MRHLFVPVLAAWVAGQSLLLASSMPDWFTDTSTEKYPGMFVGKGNALVGIDGKAAALEKAKQEALRDVAAMICCKVTGETVSRQEERGRGKNSDLKDSFVSDTHVLTRMELTDCRPLHSEVKDNAAYVMVGVNSESLLKAYRDKLTKMIGQLQTDYQLGEEFCQTDPKAAIRKYETCLELLSTITEDLHIYLFMNKWQDDMTGLVEKTAPRQKVESQLVALAGKRSKTPDELAAELVAPIVQGAAKGSSFFIYPLEYINTGFVSPFGHALTGLLKNEIVSKTGWQSVTDPAAADCMVGGQLIESGEGLFIALSVQNKKTKQESASRLFCNSNTCARIGWDNIRPVNLDKALADKKAFYDALKTSTGLKVEVATDKSMNGPVVYRYGERPKLAVRADRECYVRLIYISSDGTKDLLLDNYHIGNDKANEWVPLPQDWEVCEPGGVDQLLVQSTVGQKMPPLKVKRVELAGGYYQNLIEGPLDEAVQLTRGGKHLPPDTKIREVVYQWTIFEK